jgi:putative oxidoreductase
MSIVAERRVGPMDTDAINLALLGIRLILGGVMLAHGMNHIIGGGKIAGTGRWFASLGMKPGILHAWLASVTEVAAGTMLVLGLLTPLACAGVVGVMLVAIITNHWRNGFFIFRPGEGYEYVLTLTVVALCLAMLGSGEWSLDNPLGTVDLAGWSGLWIALVAGGGGTAILLAGFWRPERPQSS